MRTREWIVNISRRLSIIIIIKRLLQVIGQYRGGETKLFGGQNSKGRSKSYAASQYARILYSNLYRINIVIFYENIPIIIGIMPKEMKRDERNSLQTREEFTLNILTSSGSIASNGNAFHRSEWLVILLWYTIIYPAYSDSVRYVTEAIASPDVGADDQSATWSCAFHLLLNGELLFSLSLLSLKSQLHGSSTIARKKNARFMV